jgi:prepilin-type N-terminal cleavage/methylation domain-containing protein
MMSDMGNKARGFTLIELLVVIAIIGILSSVVLASLNGARKKGRDARRISDLKQIQLALEMYYDSNSSEYPDALSSLAPTFISTVPEDPNSTGSCDETYCYDNLTSAGAACSASGGVCTNYVLGAHIEGVVPAGDVDEGSHKAGASFSCADGGEGASQNEYCVMP